MKKKLYKNEFHIDGCDPLAVAAGDYTMVNGIDHSMDIFKHWAVDYDPKTDTCYSYSTVDGINPFTFEVDDE